MTGPSHDPSDSAPFDHYADWYDLFYDSKDYAAEAHYVLRQVLRRRSAPKRWLDIGCGTARHLGHLRVEGITVEGVDQSSRMIERARIAYPDIPLHVGTAQDFSLADRFDVVSMLFHVLNYQTSEELLHSAVERVYTHLAPGGVFVFDFWNSPAVALDPPVSRTRTIQVGGRPLCRVSHPVRESHPQTLSINYDFRWDSPEGELLHQERHVLRHFHASEIRALLASSGLKLETCDAWLTDRPLLDSDWYGIGCAVRAEGH